MIRETEDRPELPGHPAQLDPRIRIVVQHAMAVGIHRMAYLHIARPSRVPFTSISSHSQICFAIEGANAADRRNSLSTRPRPLRMPEHGPIPAFVPLSAKTRRDDMPPTLHAISLKNCPGLSPPVRGRNGPCYADVGGSRPLAYWRHDTPLKNVACGHMRT